ncbi:hypothetical protein KGY79_13570, partial [Candidatus Bipolaricaulota bacterium]|nr:hypothetical protein [Candidatus Bipolaricaulota bacterium]
MVEPTRVLSCFERYTDSLDTPITRARFEENLSQKLYNTTFIEDTRSLIASSLDYDIEEAMRLVHERLVQKISGDPYEGENNIFR